MGLFQKQHPPRLGKNPILSIKHSLNILTHGNLSVLQTTTKNSLGHNLALAIYYFVHSCLIPTVSLMRTPCLLLFLSSKIRFLDIYEVHKSLLAIDKMPTRKATETKQIKTPSIVEELSSVLPCSCHNSLPLFLQKHTFTDGYKVHRVQRS